MNMHTTLSESFDGAGGLPCLPAGERIYAIGDVHGRLDLLESLIATIRRDLDARPARGVRIVLLGDVVDRGDDSLALVSLCMALTERSPDFVVLKGNHEAMMVQAYRGSRTAMRVWLSSGGEATLYSWGVDADMIDRGDHGALLAAMRRRIPAATISWLDHLPISHEAGDYFFVHAGVRPGVPLHKQRAEDMLWIKDEFTEDLSGHAKMIVHGHSERAGAPEILANRIGIDTGAYRTDVLTALAIEGRATWTLQTRGPHGVEAISSAYVVKGTLREDLDVILGLAGSAGATGASGASSVKRGRFAPALVAATMAVAIVSTIALLRVPSERAHPPSSPPHLIADRVEAPVVADRARAPAVSPPVELAAGDEVRAPASAPPAPKPITERTSKPRPIRLARAEIKKPIRNRERPAVRRAAETRLAAASNVETPSPPLGRPATDSHGDRPAMEMASAEMASAGQSRSMAGASRRETSSQMSFASRADDKAEADIRRREALDLIRALRRQ